eukprot:2801085-Rhodomonas_salina.1
MAPPSSLVCAPSLFIPLLLPAALGFRLAPMPPLRTVKRGSAMSPSFFPGEGLRFDRGVLAKRHVRGPASVFMSTSASGNAGLSPCLSCRVSAAECPPLTWRMICQRRRVILTRMGGNTTAISPAAPCPALIHGMQDPEELHLTSHRGRAAEAPH